MLFTLGLAESDYIKRLLLYKNFNYSESRLM